MRFCSSPKVGEVRRGMANNMSIIYNNPNLKARRQVLRNNLTEPERRLWYFLRNKNLKGYKFRRQYGVGNFILDFYCPKLRLAIELDGDTHYTDIAKTRDSSRDQFLAIKGIVVVRFTNHDVMSNIEGVMERLSQYLP